MEFFKRWFQKSSAEKARERLEKATLRDREEIEEWRRSDTREKEETEKGCCLGKVKEEVKKEGPETTEAEIKE